MNRLKIVFIVCFALTLMGCVAVKKSLDNYEACKGDPVCLQEMQSAKEVSYAVTKTATAPFIPVSFPEAIAFVVSNVFAFGFGVVKGKKKG